ncbi:MAG: mechanosensitive ion channel [Phycisphaerales bacterium]|nr:mechanosensitive ion channel [Phycisphaerales bacterium]
MNRSLFHTLALLLALMIPLLVPGEAVGQPATTAGNADISTSDLKVLLVPLTRDELVIEADAWMGVLQAKAHQISHVEIQIGKVEGDAKQALVTQAAELRSERARLVDRLRTAVDALNAKGGDTEAYDLYIAAVTGLSVDVTDTSAVWMTITNWLGSSEGGLRWGVNIGLFLVTLIVFWIIARIVGGITNRALGKVKKTSVLLREFLVSLASKMTLVIGIVVALSMLGVNIGPFLAAIGAVGFIVGFALQGTLSNFASGIMILFYRPYDIGDAVNMAGVSGVVKAMTLVSTTITTFDNQIIIVPNNSIWGGVITNITGNDTRRVDMVFGISYSDDIGKAMRILEEIATGHELVLNDPETTIKLHELADSSVNFIVRPWSKTVDYWTVYWDVTRAVKERFDAEGISIPFPQQDVHMHQAPENA